MTLGNLQENTHVWSVCVFVDVCMRVFVCDGEYECARCVCHVV